jgi:hypothetical protein
MKIASSQKARKMVDNIMFFEQSQVAVCGKLDQHETNKSSDVTLAYDQSNREAL